MLRLKVKTIFCPTKFRPHNSMGNKSVFSKHGPPLHPYCTDFARLWWDRKVWQKGVRFPQWVYQSPLTLSEMYHYARKPTLPPPSTERGRLLRSPYCQLCGQKTALSAAACGRKKMDHFQIYENPTFSNFFARPQTIPIIPPPIRGPSRDDPD